MTEHVSELHRCQSGSSKQLLHHRGLLRVTKMRTLRMAMRRSLREVMARIVSWARFSKGRTASSHQDQAGPLGLACSTTKICSIQKQFTQIRKTFSGHMTQQSPSFLIESFYVTLEDNSLFENTQLFYFAICSQNSSSCRVLKSMQTLGTLPNMKCTHPFKSKKNFL